MSDLKDELERVVRLMVDYPDDVELVADDRGATTHFELQVADDDLGKVIGRQGRTARAMRSLLAARGARDGRRYELQIID